MCWVTRATVLIHIVSYHIVCRYELYFTIHGIQSQKMNILCHQNPNSTNVILSNAALVIRLSVGLYGVNIHTQSDFEDLFSNCTKISCVTKLKHTPTASTKAYKYLDSSLSSEFCHFF